MNANPCLAAGAGFMAAAAKAGLAAGGGRAQDPRGCGQRGGPRRIDQVCASAAVSLPADRQPVEALIRATGFFNPEEVEVALELVDDRLANGDASHYRSWSESPAAGWRAMPAGVRFLARWPRPTSTGSWSIRTFQGKGIGAALLRAAEEWMASAGRTRVYVETSTRPQYLPTRAFYAACGYGLAAELADFYAPGDGKALFLKVALPMGAQDVRPQGPGESVRGLSSLRRRP